MTENTHPQFEPEPEEHDNEALYGRAGYPYPMGPPIPRPNATWNPLWPGLTLIGLNRPKAAAEVLMEAYRNREDTLSPWKRKKEALTARMDVSMRNLWQRVHTQRNPESLLTAQVPLRVLEGWAQALRGNEYLQRKILSLIDEKLRPDLQHAYQAGRDNARDPTLLFAPPFYPAVGRKPQQVVSQDPWIIRYGQDTQKHVLDLLHEPAGEWNLLTLLFIKLLHAHMGWLVPAMNKKRKTIYYRPLLRHLRLCADRAGERDAHPLADTAEGIWQTLRRVNLLVSSGKKTDLLHPHHPDELDPRDESLPDSLHMDSSMWVGECVSEVKQILAWMDTQSVEAGWSALIPWVDDVALLAWEMASVRTDPMAAGGLGMVGKNIDKTRQIFTTHRGAWQEMCKSLCSLSNQINGAVLTPAQESSWRALPARFKAAFALKGTANVDPNTEVDHTIRALDAWAERPAQLRQFYDTTSEMLTLYGLDQFQAKEGNL